MEKTRHQAFAIETMKRSEIDLAEYNPRFINEKNRKNLKKALSDNGLVETLVVNRRTGRLVSGHQRISVLDSLEKNTDYLLDVAVIDVDEKTEAKLNVQLNQRNLQGDFDFDGLARMMDDFDLEAFELGFEDFDMKMMGLGDDEGPAENGTKEGIAAIREFRGGGLDGLRDGQAADIHFTVVCETQEEKRDFLKKKNIPVFEKTVPLKALTG